MCMVRPHPRNEVELDSEYAYLMNAVDFSDVICAYDRAASDERRVEGKRWEER